MNVKREKKTLFIIVPQWIRERYCFGDVLAVLFITDGGVTRLTGNGVPFERTFVPHRNTS